MDVLLFGGRPCFFLQLMPDNVQRDVILEIIHKHKDYLTSLEAALADVKDQTT